MKADRAHSRSEDLSTTWSPPSQGGAVTETAPLLSDTSYHRGYNSTQHTILVPSSGAGLPQRIQQQQASSAPTKEQALPTSGISGTTARARQLRTKLTRFHSVRLHRLHRGTQQWRLSAAAHQAHLQLHRGRCAAVCASEARDELFSSLAQHEAKVLAGAQTPSMDNAQRLIDGELEALSPKLDALSEKFVNNQQNLVRCRLPF